MINILAFDMDGTLLREDKTIDPRTAEAIKRAMDAGMHMVIASGRDRAGTAFVYEPLGLDKGNNFLALVNGQILYDFANKEVDLNEVLTPEDGLKIQEVCRKYNVEGIFCCGYDFYSYLSEQGRKEKALREKKLGMPKDYGLKSGRSERNFINLPDKKILFHQDINKVCMVHAPEFFEENLENLKKDLKDYDVLLIGPSWLEIMPKGVNKGHALERIAQKLGLTMDNVMAFGDAQNDLEMIKMAGIGVAMGNAMDEVKAAAKYVTDTNENNGIGKAIDRLLNGEEDRLRKGE